MVQNEKPVHFAVLKLVGLIGIVVAVIGIVMVFRGFGDFESDKFMIGGFVSAIGIMMAFCGTVFGFQPELTRMSVKSAKYIQQENREDLKDIADVSADIMSDAVTRTAGAVKDGIDDTMFCKYCGAKIDSDSKFCKECGKEL